VLAQQETERGIAMMREIVREQPEFADAHYNCGLALAGLGCWAEALEAFREAVRLHPTDAERRGIGVGARVVVHNDRGAFTAVARVEETIRPGVVWAPSIWWGKFAADGANANQTTSQRETDMGHGPVFYDNLVEVGLAD